MSDAASGCSVIIMMWYAFGQRCVAQKRHFYVVRFVKVSLSTTAPLLLQYKSAINRNP